MPSPSALIKHIESDKVLSQVYVHVGVRKTASCPLDVTAKEDFIKVWRGKQLETPGTGRKSFKKQKGRPIFLVIFILLLFPYSLFMPSSFKIHFLPCFL